MTSELNSDLSNFGLYFCDSVLSVFGRNFHNVGTRRDGDFCMHTPLLRPPQIIICSCLDIYFKIYHLDFFATQGVSASLSHVPCYRMLQFVVKIGGNGNALSCTYPIGRNEGIIVDYSTDNEVTWHVLKMVEPRIHNATTEFVTIDLPQGAKTERTLFRFWQPLGYGGKELYCCASPPPPPIVPTQTVHCHNRVCDN